MLKLKWGIRPTVKCVDCGFFGDREGGVRNDGATYLGSKFWECHADRRKEPALGDSYLAFSEDGTTWNVIGCFHRVWELWGRNSKKEEEDAKTILAEERRCKYYFPYQSGYEPAAHNEMRRDKENHRMMLYVGLINAVAVLLAALAMILLRG